MTTTERLKRSSANMEWYFANLESLRQRASFREKYVAVSNGRVLMASKSCPRLMKRLYDEHPKEAGTAYVDRVCSEPCLQIL
jgi:hypothetical protein